MENKVTVWACGGAGINVAATILETQDKMEGSSVLADMDMVLLDTSRSNYGKYQEVMRQHGVPLETIDGLDGSGQKRDENVNKISPYIGGIIEKHRTNKNDLNIIITSASGGSGSLMSALLVKQMLAEDMMVVVMLVGDSSTAVYCKNTRATIRTLEAMSRNAGRPVPVRYFQNHSGKEIKHINAEISKAVTDYRLLWSGNVHGVDSSDLYNFMNYHRVTTSEPGLCLISNILSKDTGKQVLDELQGSSSYNVISMVVVNTGNEPVNFPCEYRVDGEYIMKDSQGNLMFIITDNYFFHLLEELDNVYKTYERQSANKVNSRIDVGSANEDGLVF